MTRQTINKEEAVALVFQHGITEIAATHNAAVEFRLGDGRLLALLDGDDWQAREWTVELAT